MNNVLASLRSRIFAVRSGVSVGASVGALVLLGASGCSFGLESSIETQILPASASSGSQPESENGGDEAMSGGDELPATEADLEGLVYRISPDMMTVVNPPGLEKLKSKVLDRDVLVYVDTQTSNSLGFSVALAGADGKQDACETVRPFPKADWSENPVFDAGPGTIDASFGGEPAEFRDARFGGVFDESGDQWTDGTLSAQLDGRELEAALGGADACELVDAMGGACEPCDDGERICFRVEVEQITAVKAAIDFDPRPDASRCSR